MIPVLAYIDPASGTLLLQALIAAFIGGVAAFRRSIYGLLCRIAGLRRKANVGAPEDSDADP